MYRRILKFIDFDAIFVSVLVGSLCVLIFLV